MFEEAKEVLNCAKLGQKNIFLSKMKFGTALETFLLIYTILNMCVRVCVCVCVYIYIYIYVFILEFHKKSF